MKVLQALYVTVLLFLFCTCVVEVDSDSRIERAGRDENDVLTLMTDDGVSYKPFLVYEDVVHIAVSHDADLTRLVPKFTHGESVISINDTSYSSETVYYDFSDFIHPVKISIETKEMEVKTYKIMLYDLPVVRIDTPNGEPITSKEIRTEDCVVKLALSDGMIYNLGTAGIRVRGNSTSLLPKQPYNIKLDMAQSILGMKSSKKWVLLANAYFDRTQLHNATAFEVARLTDYAWVQSGQFVELILNGEHRGLYYLCEKIDIEKGKIEIAELKSGDIDEYKITGGYLLEADASVTPSIGKFLFVTDYFNTTGTAWTSDGPKQCKLVWFFKNPDPKNAVPDVQVDYIKKKMNYMESLIYDDRILLGGGYLDYLDIESAINWYLVEEICLNEEASRTKNMYIYKNRGDEKFYIGPPWDFDAWTFGTTGVKKFYVQETGFYYRQLFKDAHFVSRLKEKWSIYKLIWEECIPNFIDVQYALIHNAAERNETLWTDWCYPEKTYQQVVQEMKEAFLIQLAWMNEQIEKL